MLEMLWLVCKSGVLTLAVCVSAQLVQRYTTERAQSFVLKNSASEGICSSAVDRIACHIELAERGVGCQSVAEQPARLGRQ